MKTRDDIFTEVLVRNNRTTTDGFITDTLLKNWYTQAHVMAMAQHKWPFTEGRIATTFAGGNGDYGDEWYFEGYKANSFRKILVGGKKLTKLNFEDYEIFREVEPISNDRVFSEFGRVVYINPNSDVSGTLVAYGQYQPYIDVTDETALTLFSGFDEEGNEALIQEMSSYLQERQNATPTIVRGKIISQSIASHQNALEILDRIWQRVLDERAMFKTHRDRGGMFDRIDVLNQNRYSDTLRRDQFPNF